MRIYKSPGVDFHMKGAGILVVSLRGVIFGFWPHLGCSGQNTIIFSRKSLFQGCSRRNVKKLYVFNSFYLLDSYNQSLIWSLRGQKRFGHAQICLLQGFNSKFPTSIPPSYWSSPGTNVLLKSSYPASNFTKSRLEYLIH